jgi:endonuclease/exonuclease/phosphatase (EEP) superfamily protein YafD
MAMGSWRWAFMLALCGTPLMFGMAGYWPTRAVPLPDANITFRIAHLNALVYNDELESKVQFIQTSNAQLASVVEAQVALSKQLAIFTNRFPHRQRVGTGTLLLSAWPLKQLETFGDKAALYKVSPPDAKPFYVLQFHPTAPSTPERLVERDALWHRITEATMPQPLIVLGDANTVPWDPLLTTFAEKNNLKPHGWLPSFPSIMPLTPIDLLLTPPNWKTTLRRVYVPHTDHLGWVADVTL